MNRPATSTPMVGLALLATMLAGASRAREVTGAVDELPAPADHSVDFESEIRPILEGRCVACHGPEKQKSGLRLDNRADAMLGGDLGPAIEPGDSGESYLIHRVAGFQGEMVMPPSGEPLTGAQVGLLRAWIDQGANWDATAPATDERRSSDHWAFRPIGRPGAPAVERTDWVRNPIDRFILARLEAEGIAPSPEADRATLVRRLSFDLLGLPPTPGEVDAFVGDDRPDAFERLVDRLLASPHFGERWGRRWLDLARYADSDGFEKDRPRPFAYRYRDWVIDAINRDLPFDRFSVEQLAGDLLPDPSTAQLAATGFHRNTLTNIEGGVDQEEYRVAAVFDRVDTTGTVWLGLTVGCARCHTHKYDPILQREYYELFAFFNTSDEADLPAPTPEERAEYEAALGAFDAEHAPLIEAVEAFVRDELPSRFDAWRATATIPEAVEWSPLTIVEASSEGGASLTVQDDESILVEGEAPARDTYTIVGETALAGVSALRLEALADDRLPKSGPGRAGNGNFVLSEIRVEASIRYGGEPPRVVGLHHPSADHSQGGYPVLDAIDGDPETGWAILPEAGNSHVAAFETDLDVGTDCGTRFTVRLEQRYGGAHTLGKFRLSATNAPRPVRAEGVPEDVIAILALGAAERSEEQSARLLEYYRTIDPDLAALERAVEEHAESKPAEPESKLRSFAEQPGDEARDTHILIRGDFLRPGEPVEAATPDVLPPLHHEEGRTDRLDLARWLMADDQPLTARVAANRVWQYLFGAGLVATPDDFGTRGERPSHPELLDWLASEYRRLGWSRKRFLRQIVTSATYRQSSASRPDLAGVDADNRLLARQNRLRLEAEIVRDAALASAGLLSSKVGGPSVYPPQPPGISELTYAGSASWPTSEGDDRYRRGMYTFFRRTSPYPMLTTFDAPDANVCVVRREQSNTPLQALTLLNNRVFVGAARALGLRAWAEAPCDCPDGRLEHAFRLAMGRSPTLDESAILADLFEGLAGRYRDDPSAEAALLGDAPVPEGASPAEAAAMIAASRAILNLDEFITRE